MKRFKTVTHPLTGKAVPEFLAGVITPMYTPCNPDLSLDETGLRNMVEFFKSTGAVRSLFPRCGLGKMYTYSFKDTRQIIDIVGSQNDGALYFLPGTAGIYNANPAEKPDPQQYIDQSIELSQYARERGADAVVLVVPSALKVPAGKTHAEVIVDYFERMNKALDLPIVVYHPGGLEESYRFTPEIMAAVSQMDKVVGMKFSSSNMSDYTELTLAIGDADFSLFAGSETIYLYALVLGGLGVIGQGADNVPEILKAVYDRFMAGDIAGARQAQLDVNRTVYCAKNTSMSLVGLHYLKHRGVALNTIARGETSADPARVAQIIADIDAVLQPYLAQ